MTNEQTPPKRPAPLWASYGPNYAVEKYDFQVWKRSDPPPIDADPDIRKFPDAKRAPQV